MFKSIVIKIVDYFTAVCLAIASPMILIAARGNPGMTRCRSFLDGLGIGLVHHHYYEPLVYPSDLRHSLDEERSLPGVNLNERAQLDLLGRFTYRDELLSIPMEKTAADRFGYNNVAYGSGDAEILYDVIRHYKPRRIVEIGSGQSTLIARLAIKKNSEECADYNCRHICIEPFEQPMLEHIGVEVIRQRVECCSLELFSILEEGDIFFIDSSHVIRPQGDVLFEYLELLPSLKPGVLIHVHDIFTPRDYLADWIITHRKMWNEQYLLEAFLTFNSEFSVVLALNWLKHHHWGALEQACPILMQQPDREPGAFWICRK